MRIDERNSRETQRSRDGGCGREIQRRGDGGCGREIQRNRDDWRGREVQRSGDDGRGRVVRTSNAGRDGRSAPGDRVLRAWVAAELAVLAGASVVVAASLAGATDLLADVPRRYRVAALGFLIVELCIPAWIYWDVRRRSGMATTTWVSVGATPVLNLIGFVVYLLERRRRGGAGRGGGERH